jgi:MFS transporter, FHS family, glucose/mannose:H+ symporter
MNHVASANRLIFLTCLGILIFGMVSATLGTLQPYWAAIGLNPEQTAYVALGQAVGMILASLIAGPLCDNKGKKTGLLLGLGSLLIGLAALPHVVSFVMIIAALFLVGLGGGILVTSVNALLSDISAERRAAVLNFVSVFFGLGGMLAPFLVANLLSRNSAESAVQFFYVMVALVAVTLVVYAATKIPPPTGQRGFKFSEAGELLGRPALWLLVVYMFLYVSCELNYWNWLTRHLMAQGIKDNAAQNILSFGFALGLLVGRIAVLPVLMRVSVVTVTLGATALMAVSTFCVLQTNDPALVGLAVFFAGMAMAPVFPNIVAMTGGAFDYATGTAIGIVITSGWVGLAVSSRIIGAIAGDDPARLGTALYLLPAFSVAMIVVNLALRPFLRRPRSAEVRG